MLQSGESAAKAVDVHAGNPFQNALRNGIGSRRVGAAENDDEFFAAVPPDDIRLPESA